MSVMMILRWKDMDRDTIRALHDEVAPKVNELARSMGASHHHVYYAPQSNECVMIDEWPSPLEAEQFWGTDQFREMLGAAGGRPPDEVTVLESAGADTAYEF